MSNRVNRIPMKLRRRRIPRTVDGLRAYMRAQNAMRREGGELAERLAVARVDRTSAAEVLDDDTVAARVATGELKKLERSSS